MSEFKFLYWDDLGDSQEEVDNQNTSPCANHALQQDIDEMDLIEERLLDAEWQEKEEEWNNRMDIIGQNGNNGDHYFSYFKNHPSAADYEDCEDDSN